MDLTKRDLEINLVVRRFFARFAVGGENIPLRKQCKNDLFVPKAPECSCILEWVCLKIEKATELVDLLVSLEVSENATQADFQKHVVEALTLPYAKKDTVISSTMRFLLNAGKKDLPELRALDIPTVIEEYRKSAQLALNSINY